MKGADLRVNKAQDYLKKNSIKAQVRIFDHPETFKERMQFQA